jgi:hypothetical protein
MFCIHGASDNVRLEAFNHSVFRQLICEVHIC